MPRQTHLPRSPKIYPPRSPRINGGKVSARSVTCAELLLNIPNPQSYAPLPNFRGKGLGDGVGYHSRFRKTKMMYTLMMSDTMITTSQVIAAVNPML